MGKHVVIWLMLTILLPSVYPALVSTQTMSGFIASDYLSALAIFGDKARIDHDLVIIYQKNLSAINNFANEFRDKHDDSQQYKASGDRIGETIGDIPGDWAQAIKLQSYSLALRWVILTSWGVWLVLPLGLGIVVGWYQRKLKYETFSPPAPPLYNSCAHFLIALFFMVLLWLLCPFPIPISFMPILGSGISIILSIAVANYPKY